MIDNQLFFLYCGPKSGGGLNIEEFWVEREPVLKTNRLFVFE